MVAFVFTILTTITGAVWAQIAWGTWWNWDPRESSIVFLLLIYTAYFALHVSLDGTERQHRFGAAYLVFAAAVMPFFVFVVPRVYASLHPDTIINSAAKMHLVFITRSVLLLSISAFASLFFFIFSISNRITLLEQKQMEEGDAL